MMGRYTDMDLAWAKRWGQVTRSGIHYSDDLAGSEGVTITFLLEGTPSAEALADAKAQLRHERDVVGFAVATRVAV